MSIFFNLKVLPFTLDILPYPEVQLSRVNKVRNRVSFQMLNKMGHVMKEVEYVLDGRLINFIIRSHNMYPTSSKTLSFTIQKGVKTYQNGTLVKIYF